MKILIADDHKPVRENLRAILKEQQPDWEISEATNGEEAVELFRKNQPDAVVLDIVMAPLGGVAAAYDIREIDPRAKIIFVSSHYTALEASVLGRMVGGAAFVPKSEAATELVPAIARCLRENQVA